MKDMVGEGKSPGCGVITEKSTDLASIRGGVPVFRRPTGNFNSRKRCAREIDGGSPARPPLDFSRPT